MKSLQSIIVLGSTGLIGSYMCERLRSEGFKVTAIHSGNYSENLGIHADAMINCNGNSYRFKANENPAWDFNASVMSVEKSLFDFSADLYIYMSTVDVYQNLHDPDLNGESATCDPRAMDTYGFHKWLAERVVEKFSKRSAILRMGTVIGPKFKKGPLFDLLNHMELRMSADSELSLVDTDMIYRVVQHLIKNPPERMVLNVAGSGFVSPKILASAVDLPIAVSAQDRGVKYRYNINNNQLKSILPVETSEEIGLRFMKAMRGLR
jgi:nucleoside-diphosphate-sugar epimerase